MRDRNVQYANHYRMTKVAGTDDIFELTPAPGVVEEEGTLINKFALLKDATATLYGFGDRLDDVVPDDVLAYLGRYAQHTWRRRLSESGYGIVRTEQSEVSMYYGISSTTNYEQTLYYADAVDIDQEAGTFALRNPASTLVTYDNIYSIAPLLVGKYFISFRDSGTGTPDITALTSCYYGGAGISATRSTSESDSGVIYYHAGVTGELYNALIAYITDKGPWEIIRSPNRDAYPDSGVLDGYEYEYLGVPLDNAVSPVHIETGSYLGTGTYTVNNPNTISFGFLPKLVIVAQEGYSALPNDSGNTSLPGWQYSFIWSTGCTRMHVFNDLITASMDEETNTLSWYSRSGTQSSANTQLNVAGTTYNYIAIG